MLGQNVAHLNNIAISITNAQYTTMVGLCFAVWWIGHFRVPKTLTSKMRPTAQPSFENEFYLHENVESFPYQRLSTWPHFDTEARGNSKMAYWHLLLSFQVKQRVVTLLNQHGGSMKDIRAVMRGQSCEMCASISCQQNIWKFIKAMFTLAMPDCLLSQHEKLTHIEHRTGAVGHRVE